MLSGDKLKGPTARFSSTHAERSRAVGSPVHVVTLFALSPASPTALTLASTSDWSFRTGARAEGH